MYEHDRMSYKPQSSGKATEEKREYAGEGVPEPAESEIVSRECK